MIDRTDVRLECAILAEHAARLSSGVRTDLAAFPSGAVMLDVFYQSRLFVLAYSPADGFGVDEVDEDTDGLGTFFRHNFDNFTAARGKLLALLTAAMG